LSDHLKRNPNTLEDLKFVLGTITDIRDMSLSVEMRIDDIQERYRTLSMYNVEVSVSDSRATVHKPFSLNQFVIMKDDKMC